MRIQETSTGLLVHTPAKINLSLKVHGRRPDGYHELETRFASIGIYDTLLFEPASSSEVSLQIQISSPALKTVSLSADSRNLVIKAAEILRRSTGQDRGARITLWKRIPVEAGMGGGSSDAAATLVALNRLWGSPLTQQDLHGLAARLGSDVNFFLDSVPLGIGRGRGEAIEPVTRQEPLHIVLIKPPSGLSTKQVFETLNAPLIGAGAEHKAGQRKPDQAISPASGGSSDREPVWADVLNDLEPVARQLNPEVDRILTILERERVLASAMTGSGTACFALCHSHRQAMTIAARLRAIGLGAVYATQLRT